MTKQNNTTVVINLDRPRFLRYGHKALKRMTAITGMNMEDIDETEWKLEDLEKILWCGLLEDAQANGEDLKLEDMEDLLDKAERYGDIMHAMHEALSEAFKRTEKEKN
jgi:hypothetical protein